MAKFASIAQFHEHARKAVELLSVEAGLGHVHMFCVCYPGSVTVDFQCEFKPTVEILVRLFKSPESHKYIEPWSNTSPLAFQPDSPSAKELGYEPGVIRIDRKTHYVTRVTFCREAQ